MLKPCLSTGANSCFGLKKSALIFKLPALKSPNIVLKRFLQILIILAARYLSAVFNFDIFNMPPSTKSHTLSSWNEFCYQDQVFTWPHRKAKFFSSFFTQDLYFPERQYSCTISSPFSGKKNPLQVFFQGISLSYGTWHSFC